MKLITKALENRFNQIGSQEDELDPIVISKMFNPCGSGTWYMTELHPNYLGFGYVTGLGYDEWGYFSLHELETLKCPPLNLPIERDLYCGEKRISEHCPELRESIERRKELRESESGLSNDQNLER